MSESQEVYHVSELGLISYTCKCGTTITVDVADHAGTPNPDNPPPCPTCHEKLEPFSHAVHAYQDFYTRYKQLIRLSTKPKS